MDINEDPAVHCIEMQPSQHQGLLLLGKGRTVEWQFCTVATSQGCKVLYLKVVDDTKGYHFFDDHFIQII